VAEPVAGDVVEDVFAGHQRGIGSKRARLFPGGIAGILGGRAESNNEMPERNRSRIARVSRRTAMGKGLAIGFLLGALAAGVFLRVLQRSENAQDGGSAAGEAGGDRKAAVAGSRTRPPCSATWRRARAEAETLGEVVELDPASAGRRRRPCP